MVSTYFQQGRSWILPQHEYNRILAQSGAFELTPELIIYSLLTIVIDILPQVVWPGQNEFSLSLPLRMEQLIF